MHFVPESEIAMLTSEDLSWSYKSFSLSSKLNLFPVTFRPVLLGGQMETGQVSTWKKIGFKFYQMIFTCRMIFISFRTLQYMTGFGFSGEETNLNWDFVPILLIFTAAFVTGNFIAYFIFDVGRELNVKLYNELIKLRGKVQIHLLNEKF